MKGRKRKSSQLKILEGNRGHRGKAKARGSYRGRAPTCPTWVKGYARSTWKRVGPELRRLGILTFLDRDTFAAYCIAVASLKHAEDVLAAEGEYLTNEKGKRFRHPASTTRAEASQQVRLLAELFFLTPGRREKLPGLEVEIEDDLLD